MNEDYAGLNVRTRHWRNLEDTMFVLSVMQGPAAAANSITAWGQYLRRVTTYACMCFGIVSANLVTNDAACKIPDDEWLRMYHYRQERFLLNCGRNDDHAWLQ